jgi:outer membrane receptor protein involved in Fe transport
METGSLLLSAVVTTATRSPMDASRVATTIHVLDAAQVATDPARETQDLLRAIPGVELPRASTEVGSSAQIVSIRGSDEGRALVMFDGVPLNDAWGDWIDWSRAPKSMLDRIEVMEGGGSSLYGSPALGGVISLLSRPLTPGSYRIEVEGGSRSTQHLFASGSAAWRSLTASFTGDYGSGGGYDLIVPAGAIDGASSSIRRNAIGRLSYAPSARLSVFGGGHLFSDDRALGTPLQRGLRRNRGLDVGAEVGQVLRGLVSFRGWISEMNEDQYASAITASRDSERLASWQNIPSHDAGASVQWSRSDAFGFVSLSGGADIRRLSGSVAEETYAATSGIVTRTSSGGQQSISGLFVQGVLSPLERLRVELGARTDYWRNTGGFTHDVATTTEFAEQRHTVFSPRAGVRVAASTSLAFRAAAYRAFRAPSLAQLYRKFTSGTLSMLPNPALEPEYVTGRELGVDYRPTAWLQLRGTGYIADMKNLSAFVALSATRRQRQSVQGARSKGLELGVELRPLETLEVSAGLNYDADRITAYPDPSVVGTRMPRVPVQRQVVRVAWMSSLGAWTLLMRHEGASSSSTGARLQPFTVLDTRVTRDVGRGLQAFIAIENLGNALYPVSALGTTLSVGLPRTVRLGVGFARE